MTIPILVIRSINIKLGIVFRHGYQVQYSCYCCLPSLLLLFVIDMDIKSNIVAVVTCSHCCCLSLALFEIKKQGLEFQLKLICTGDNCTWPYICWTSKKKSRNFDVNRRIIYSMRGIGNGYQGLKKF